MKDQKSNKKVDQSKNYKSHNLSELSISQIYDNKIMDQSEDFQQERYLINTIAQTENQISQQYGIDSNRIKANKKKLSSKNLYETDASENHQHCLSGTETLISSEKSNILAFNKHIKQKKSMSKQKSPYQLQSLKIHASTRPVPNVMQHAFKSNLQSKNKVAQTKKIKPASRVKVCISNQNAMVETNMHQVPIPHTKYKNGNIITKKQYYMMKDDIKFEINDLNCQLFEEPVLGIYMDTEKLRLYHRSNDKTQNKKTVTDPYINRSPRSSQLTNFNDTQSFQKVSWVYSSRESEKVFELKRPRSFDGRHYSNFSSTKTDRYDNFSQNSGDSSKTTKKVERTYRPGKSKEIHNLSNFYRRSQKQQVREGGRQQYFADGRVQGSLTNIISYL